MKLKDTLGNFITENENDKPSKIRTKRDVWPPNMLNLEIAIFVDQDLYKLMAVSFESNTEMEIIRFVLAMVNAVSNIIRYELMKRPIITLRFLIIPFFLSILTMFYF